MKEKYTQDNLNEFFEEFKNLPNSYKIDQVHRLLNNPHAKATHSVKSHFKYLKLIIMTSTILIGIISLYVWLAPENANTQNRTHRHLVKSTLSIQENKNSQVVQKDTEKVKLNEKRPSLDTNQQANNNVPDNPLPKQTTPDISLKQEKKSLKIPPRNSDKIKNDDIDPQQGIRLIELNKSEYIQLGFIINDKEISHYSRNSECIWEIFLGLKGYGCRKHNSSEQIDTNKPNFIFLSGINGFQSIKWKCPTDDNKKWEDDYFKDKIQELVPVIIRKVDFPEFLIEDQVFWFEPSPELFNNLPKRISEDLEKEYYLLVSLKQTRDKLTKMLEEMEKVANNSKQQRENQAQDCYYFEGCKSTLEIKKLNTYPNPSQDKLNVEFSLQKSTTGKISLVSISGQTIKSLIPYAQFVEGLNMYSFNVSDLESGIYLLKIITPDGFKTQRIIISR